MATDERASGFCQKCNRNVLVTRPGTSHVLHLLLSLLTAGLWLIVWILVAVKVGGWRCTACGKPARRFGTPKEMAACNRTCPHCAEQIKAEASKCRHCQSEITPTQTAASIAKAKSEQAKDKLVGYSAIAVIVVIVIIVAQTI